MNPPAFLDIQFAPHRTANSAAPVAELLSVASLMTSANAIAERDVPADGWYVVADYGDHPSPDKSYTQVFTREEAEETVRTWNSLPARAFRMMKNLRHRLKPALSIPIVELHVDTDPTDWSQLATLGQLTDVRATANALEGYVTWNRQAMANRRTDGPLYPSILWWHEAPNAEGKVFPTHLESVALVPNPNLSTVPAWTKNASPEAANTNNNQGTHMLKRLIELLGLGANATEDEAITKVGELKTTANSAQADKAALTTANSAKADLETQLTTANGKVTTLEGEKASLANEVATLKTANATLTEGVLDLFEAAGKFTPAERESVKAKFTANVADSAAAITELKNKKPAINTQSLEINGNRLDLSTANARQSALEGAITKRMDADKCDRGTAYDRVMADPAYKQLVEAMKPKTAAAA